MVSSCPLVYVQHANPLYTIHSCQPWAVTTQTSPAHAVNFLQAYMVYFFVYLSVLAPTLDWFGVEKVFIFIIGTADWLTVIRYLDFSTFPLSSYFTTVNITEHWGFFFSQVISFLSCATPSYDATVTLYVCSSMQLRCRIIISLHLLSSCVAQIGIFPLVVVWSQFLSACKHDPC